MASPEVKPQKRVALVIAERDGLVLFGKRRDNGRWTLPGGHVEDGEEPAAAARRELKEEAGLEPKGDLREVDHRVNGPVELWTYRCEVEGVPSGKGDPDEECELWAFLDASKGIPKPVAENMAGPKDPDKNVAADVLGLAKMAIADIPAPTAVTAGHPSGESSGWDYSHLLPEAARKKNLHLIVTDPKLYEGVSSMDQSLADLHALRGYPARGLGSLRSGLFLGVPGHDRSVNVGKVDAFIERGEDGNYIEPHAHIHPDFRGIGVGNALYSALYAHAMRHGIKRVRGSHHSTEASRVHASLARRHGLEYDPRPGNPEDFAGRGSYKPYEYALKGELEPVAKADDDLVTYRDTGSRYEQALEKPKSGDPHEIHPMPSETRINGNLLHPIPTYDYSHHLSEGDRASGQKLVGYSDRPHEYAMVTVPHVAWLDEGGRVKGVIHSVPGPSGEYGYRSNMGHAPPSIHEAAKKALLQHIEMQKPLEAMERVRRAQIEQGWGEPGVDSTLHGPLHREQAGRELSARLAQEGGIEGVVSPAESAAQEPAGEVRRVHNRFVGTKATEKTSGLGNTRRPMAERMAFDYSHHLTPEQRAQGLTLTVYHHPSWTPNPALDRGAWSGPANRAPATPIAELLHNGMDPGIAFPSGVPGAMAAKNAALTEHEANAKRTIGPEYKKAPYLDSLPLPPQGERAQLLEIDQPKRRRAAKAKPAAPALIDQDLAARAKNLETDEGVQPLQVPPHREMSNDERHLLWDYSHLLSPEDRAAGRRLEIRHTPGRFDDYMHANYFDYHDPTASRTAWAYPRTMDDLSFNSTAGQAPNPAITEAMRRAYAHHRQLHLRGQLEPVIQNVQGSRFANLELSERAMIKAEADEVDRLLTHPDPAERTMALKLAGVRGRHLARAFGDSDPAVRRAALRHPALDRHALLQLMQTPGMADAQLAALAHPRIGREHIEALYHTAKQDPGPDRLRLLHAVSHHGLLDAPLIERMHAEGNGDATVENLNTPPHVVDRIVESHLADPRDDRKRALARRALKHPKISASLVERAWKEGTGDVRIAVAQSQHLPEALAQDALQRGLRPEGDSEALLRSFIVNNPKATEAHLKTAAKDRNPLVRHQARSKLGLTKFESQHAAFLGEQLAKATRPDDLKSIARATDPSGASVVDHSLEYDAHPPEHAADVAAYREAVLRGPATVRRTGTKVNAEGTDSGVTRKVIYTVPANHPTHGGVRYMVKPYHERIIRRAKSWMRHPHQGWSEMTNQALYHAGGIGDLHQGVHVSEHDMGPGREHEPALVVRIDPGYQDIDHAVAGSYHRGNPQFPEHVREQARRISLMDMLTNNLDRHFGNLLYRDAGGASQSLLAIDHPRSFQYVSTARDMNRPMRTKATGGHDRFSDYVNGSALRELNPLERSNDVSDNIATINRWQPTFDWWADHSDAIKKAFEQRLRLIKDPEIRAHLSRNFHARARWLDQRAHFGLAQHGQDWYDDEVPMYRPGEISEEERDALMDPEGQS